MVRGIENLSIELRMSHLFRSAPKTKQLDED